MLQFWHTLQQEKVQQQINKSTKSIFKTPYFGCFEPKIVEATELQ